MTIQELFIYIALALISFFVIFYVVPAFLLRLLDLTIPKLTASPKWFRWSTRRSMKRNF